MVQDQANNRLVSDLNSDSQYLDSLQSAFYELFQKVDFRTISIYETKLSNTVEESICYPTLEYWPNRSDYRKIQIRAHGAGQEV